ncbi:hypothetical protein HDE77_001618 [Rhodanobacter sp. MP7CTX1]|jgi:hypothetical protein|nr:hypothetical protein [Rhodanobacter sp. MP7CTX1]
MKDNIWLHSRGVGEWPISDRNPSRRPANYNQDLSGSHITRAKLQARVAPKIAEVRQNAS